MNRKQLRLISTGISQIYATTLPWDIIISLHHWLHLKAKLDNGTPPGSLQGHTTIL